MTDHPPPPDDRPGWYRVDNSDAGVGGPGWQRVTSQGNDYRSDFDARLAEGQARVAEARRILGSMDAPPARRRASVPRRARRAVLRAFAAAQRPASWLLLLGGLVTFVGVLVGWITVGEFRWPTLLIAAGLVVDGFGAVQEAEDDEDPDA